MFIILFSCLGYKIKHRYDIFRKWVNSLSSPGSYGGGIKGVQIIVQYEHIKYPEHYHIFLWHNFVHIATFVFIYT